MPRLHLLDQVLLKPNSKHFHLLLRLRLPLPLPLPLPLLPLLPLLH
jgi:hypothetical protein